MKWGSIGWSRRGSASYNKGLELEQCVVQVPGTSQPPSSVAQRTLPAESHRDARSRAALLPDSAPSVLFLLDVILHEPSVF